MAVDGAAGTPRRWGWNPYALARIATGEEPGSGDWEALLAHAFKASASDVLYGSDGTRALIDDFAALADGVGPDETLAGVLERPAARDLAQRMGREENVARLLALLVPLRDVQFAPGTGPSAASAVAIGSYRAIGALDVAGVSWTDPVQGCTNDCYLIAMMSALAWARPNRWRARLAAATQGSKDATLLRVGFRAAADATPDPPPFDVPARVPRSPSDQWIYAHSADRDETWPALLERAFVMEICGCTQGEPTVAHYRRAGEFPTARQPQDAGRMLMGGVPRARLAGEGADAAHALVARYSPHGTTAFPMVAWTRPPGDPAWRDPRARGLNVNHAYTVLGTFDVGGKRFVVLRDPQHVDLAQPEALQRDWPAGAARNGGAPVRLGHGGVFAIAAARYDAYFPMVGWVELPED